MARGRTIDVTVQMAPTVRAAVLAALRAAVMDLPDHSVSGYEWECGNCTDLNPKTLGFVDSQGRTCPNDSRIDASISRDAVLDLIDRLAKP